jgi:hypothetical protein
MVVRIITLVPKFWDLKIIGSGVWTERLGLLMSIWITDHHILQAKPKLPGRLPD